MKRILIILIVCLFLLSGCQEYEEKCDNLGKIISVDDYYFDIGGSHCSIETTLGHFRVQGETCRGVIYNQTLLKCSNNFDYNIIWGLE